MRTSALALLAFLLVASQVIGQDDSLGTKVPKCMLEVHVFDKHSNLPLPNAELVLRSNGTEILRLFREDSTVFRTELPYIPQIDAVVSVPQHLNAAFSVRPADHSEETTFIIEVFLLRIVTGDPPPPVVLFQRNSSHFTSAAHDAFAVVLETLKDNPTIVVEVGGHSDALEKEDLAQERCEAVQSYLVGLGIPKERVLIQTYGKERPRISIEQINALATRAEREAAHAENRRVEFKIVGWDWVPDKD
jgi:outer membrane protein OmpA-like peptidoglycan-associated protein